MRRVSSTTPFILVSALLLSCLASPVRAASFDGGRDDSSAVPAELSQAAKNAASKKVEKPSPLANDERLWVIITAPDKGTRNRIVTAGVAIEDVRDGKVAGFATPHALQRLQDQGIKVERRTALATISTQDFPKPDGTYHDYSRTEAELNAIASANKDIASVFSIGKSWQGRSILALRLNSTEHGDQPSKKPGAVFMGTHHAREHLSTEVPLLIARWIVDNRGRADIKKLLDTRDIYFIPLVNPDGAEYDIATGSYRWQRKNMSKNADGSVGVDINRNYGWLWGGPGASDYPGDDTYRGPSAFSEPESQAIRDFLTARPNLSTSISYHSFSELVLYPWGGTEDAISDGRALKAYKAMAAKMASWTGYTAQQSSELYVATGDSCDWAWGERKIFSFTIELTPNSGGAGGFYPGAKVVGPTVQKNIQPVLYLIALADDPYRAGEESAK
jgi:carboxypeptidase T